MNFFDLENELGGSLDCEFQEPGPEPKIPQRQEALLTQLASRSSNSQV
jgi:hypothetical protein